MKIIQEYSFGLTLLTVTARANSTRMGKKTEWIESSERKKLVALLIGPVREYGNGWIHEHVWCHLMPYETQTLTHCTHITHRKSHRYIHSHLKLYALCHTCNTSIDMRYELDDRVWKSVSTNKWNEALCLANIRLFSGAFTFIFEPFILQQRSHCT